MKPLEMEDHYKFCESFFQYKRNRTVSVKVGKTSIGGDAPIRVQSMTTTSTMDTSATVDQSIKIADAGGELVRITTQGQREASNLINIKKELRDKGYSIPLVADVHFNPSAAEIAAKIIEKVRINPGNFTGGAKKFREIETGSDEDKAGLQQIEEKFVPFLKLCREQNTAIRIGTNHGSLSDRIMSKYGDTPEGMVESCMEYLRICRRENFQHIVLSIKSSNTRVMVHTVRLLVDRMARENMKFPLHLGVTEAGSGEDGRLKSAAGIGALLADGIGDTIRVSLTEPPENEIPVAQKLVHHFSEREGSDCIKEVPTTFYSPVEYKKRTTHSVSLAGAEKPVSVLADVRHFSDLLPGKETPDMVWCHHHQINELPREWNDVVKLVDHSQLPADKRNDVLPLFNVNEAWRLQKGDVAVNISYSDLSAEVVARLREKSNVLLLLEAQQKNCSAEFRAFFMAMQSYGLTHPVLIHYTNNDGDIENFQIKTAADTGMLFLDGYGDGICLSALNQPVDTCIAASFGILQASRVRFSKTEYISCPGCGRTLFDLQTTTEKVRQKTSHLKGLKIAVMGCIVNGIGEMADADYGYVGAGRGKISLFRNRELIRKNISEDKAVDELVHLIKEHGDWNDPAE